MKEKCIKSPKRKGQEKCIRSPKCKGQEKLLRAQSVRDKEIVRPRSKDRVTDICMY